MKAPTQALLALAACAAIAANGAPIDSAGALNKRSIDNHPPVVIDLVRRGMGMEPESIFPTIPNEIPEMENMVHIPRKKTLATEKVVPIHRKESLETEKMVPIHHKESLMTDEMAPIHRFSINPAKKIP